MLGNHLKEYAEITTYGYIRDDKVYLKGYLDFEDREIGVVRESEEESLQYFVNRFDLAKKKIHDIKEAVEKTENKGSYLMKLIHMRTYLSQYNGLGDFESLLAIIDELELQINAYIAKNREKNTDIKTALLAEIEQIKDDTLWKETTEKIKAIKLNWIKTGSAHKEHEETLNSQFNAAIEYFFEKRRAFFAEQIKISKERLANYRKLLEEVQFINRKGGGPPHKDRVKEIQQLWKTVGRIDGFRYKKVFPQFKKEMNIFFERLKKQESEDFKPKTPPEIKRELFEEVEKILENQLDYGANIGEIKRIQGQWKTLGRFPTMEDRSINLKFRIACNEIFETYFLERTAFQQHSDLKRKTPEDQLNIKIDLLAQSIQTDQEELNTFNEDNFYELSQPRNPANAHLQQKKSNYINKLKTKQRILKKLQDKRLPEI